MRNFYKLAFLCLLIVGIAIPLTAQFPGNALYFEQGDYVEGTGISTSMSSVTIECWVKHDFLPVSGYQRYVSLKSETAVIRAEAGGVLKFYIKNSAGTIRSVTATVLTANEWMHVAGTYDGTTLKLYIDGREVGSNTTSGSGFSGWNGEFNFSHSGNEAFRGYMDDIRVWSTARTQAQIRDNRFKEVSTGSTGLAHYWKLNSSNGTTATDSKGTANGTLYNMTDANWVASGVPSVSDNVGNAISFDGVDDIIDVQLRSGLPAWNIETGNAYTISMWVKGYPQSYTQTFYKERNSGLSSGVLTISGMTDGKALVDMRPDASTVWVLKASTSIVLDGDWHHIAWVDNNGACKLYIDGVQNGSDASYTRGAYTADQVTIGAHRNTSGNATARFNGQMDEICIWNIALSGSQVSEYMSTFRTGTESGLAAYYKFNETGGNVVYDVAGGNNGIMSNMSDASRVPSGAYLGPTFSGTISTNTTWSGSLLVVNGNVTVNNGVTLTINPGTTVYIPGNYKISVQGRVLANGALQDSIKFKGSTTNRWNGFRFVDTPSANNASTFNHCSFTFAGAGAANPDNRGTAFYVSNYNKVNITNCSFRDNHNSDPTGFGGTVFLSNAGILIQNTEFKNNKTESSGGAIYTGGGGATRIEYCSFIGNQALSGSGGAILIGSGEARITNCVFRNNSAQNSGGGVYFTGSSNNSARLTNCILDGNSANQGGAISYWTDNLVVPKVINCTIINNTATTYGGGIYLATPTGKDILNTIIWGNSASSGNQVYVSGAGTMNFRHCNIQGSLAAFAFSGTPLTDNYVACFNLDPQISYSASNPGTGYMISEISPCINAGDPTTELTGTELTDINGNNRVYNNTLHYGELRTALDKIDVGAIEDQNGFAIIPDGTVLNSNTDIVTDLYLYQGRTLTINPGVTLDFFRYTRGVIHGNLIAVGTPTQMVKFTGSGFSRWGGLSFLSTDGYPNTESRLEYCIVERGVSDTGNEAWGGNIHVWYYSKLTIKNSIIRDGDASIGGALYSRNSTIDFFNTVISDNVCSSRGTGVYCNNSTVRLINCTITGNSKTGSQSNIGYIAPVYFNSISTQPVIRNCIVWGNNTTAPLYAESGVTFSDVSYCNIEGGYSGTGNIDVNPHFTGGTTHPYNIERYSFCTNAGIPDVTGLDLPSADLLGNSRIHAHATSTYDRVDIGAYEYPGMHAPGPFAASDGNNDYPGYVRLTWDHNPNYNITINGFKIIRNGSHLETLSSELRAFSDYNVVPGTIYTYVVQAYSSNETGDSHEDGGYIKPNGIISGNIKTPNNNPVMGVKISISPSVGYCLHLSSGNSASISIPSPNANMNFNFTLELWAKTTGSNVILFYSGTHTLSIDNGRVKYSDGVNTLIQQDLSVNINDADWHHIAIVNDFTNNQVQMYLDDVVAASSSAYIFGNYVSSSFNIPAGLTGYIDDLRIWEAARDSSEVVTAMGIVVPYDSPGLKGYWAMNEGTGNRIYDATNNSVIGTISGATWSSADPNIKLGAITNAWGDYVITQISYGSATTFAVVPSLSGHMFQPEQRLVTLSNSTIAANNVDFIDNSLIPITGYVKFQSTIVPVEGAVVYLNGSPAMPPVTSNSQGYYVLEVEHGSNCIISVEYNDHPFNRSWNLGSVSYPRSNINFEDILRTEFKLDVVGGVDSYPIGDFDVSAVSVCGRYTKDVSGQNWSSGGIMVANIPPLNYNVTVNPAAFDPFDLAVDNQFQSLKTQAIDMRNPGAELDTLRFEWRAPLHVNVAWDDSLSLKSFAAYPNNQFRVLTQNEWYSVIVTAFEDYSYEGHPNQITYLNDCSIAINDEVGSRGSQSSAFEGETEYTYTFAPFLPNTLDGYDRQYQNLLEITVRDEARNRFATQGDWIITQGVRPTESTFATTSPEIPLLVLHDPPGDKSQVTFNQTNTHTTTLSTSVVTNQELGASITMHLGPTFSWSGGTPFFSKETNIEVTNDFSDTWSFTAKQDNSWEKKVTFTTSSELATSDSDDIIGDGADVFMGAAINLVWGVTEELYWDYEEDDVVLDTSVMVHPDGFDTQYIYTDSQIRNIVIPNLILIGDTASAEMWQDILDANEENKLNAEEHPDFPANVSFCGGPSYTLSSGSSTSNTRKFEWEVEVSREFGTKIGHKVDGVGVGAKFTFKAGISVGRSNSTENEEATTTTIVLADDDIASDLTFNSDYFTVDIKKDPVYGTPVFNLISGASSNHWEPNTMPRDGVMMAANSYTATDIQEGQPAVFLLYLSNTSQTNEPRRYYLEVMHATNYIGATVKINGIPLAQRMAFDLDDGQTVTAVLTVEPGPMGYELEGLTLEFYADGDRGYDGPAGHYFDIFKSFNIFWEAPFSRVRIAQPQNNWLINQASDNTLTVMLTDYDLSKPEFSSIKLEYKLISSDTWLPALEILRSELEDHPRYINVSWSVDGLSDGLYEIRACTTDNVMPNWYTTSLAGVIDRAAPMVAGLPQPSDGILQLGDEISVRFTEAIDPVSILPGCVTMMEVGGVLNLDIEIQFSVNAIYIVPQVANYWMENKTFKVTVSNLRDLHGNQMTAPVEWEFYVNANPVYWQTSKIELIKPLGNAMSFSTRLINSGGQQSSFAIQDLPPWLSATPMNGTLMPLDDEIITFTISSQLGFGSFNGTLYANIPGLGMEPLKVVVSVLLDPPAWTSILNYNYDNTMTVTGQMVIDGAVSEDLNDVIGAFILNGDGVYECRGVAQTEYVQILDDSYQFFLTIYSDSEYGEPIQFRIWDASQCKEYYGIIEEYVFMEGGIHGTPVTPEIIHTSNNLIREISLKTGWNWISTNLQNENSMQVNNVLGSLDPAVNDIIKSQTQYSQYTGTSWVGSLANITTDKGYKIKLAGNDILTLTGGLEDPDATDITYGSGWNWISYVPHVSISVSEALGNIHNLGTGDMLKSQKAFAQYVDGHGWIGSLRFMNPGEAYMLKTANSGTFTYPEYTMTRGWKRYDDPEVLDPIAGWELDPLAYEYSSNITTILQWEGQPPEQEVILGAFVGSECRGIAQAIDVMGQPMYFLTIYANTINETLSFKAYFPASGTEVSISVTLPFINNQVLGNPLQPYIMALPSLGLTSPKNLILTVQFGKAILSWDAVQGADSYKVYSSPNPNACFETWTLLAENVILPNWTDVAGADMKFYRVTACKNGSREDHTIPSSPLISKPKFEDGKP